MLDRNYSAGRKAGPDKGYAWIVAMVCFFINFLLLGVARSVAVLYAALVDDYGTTRQAAAMPFTIRHSVKNLVGPLTAFLGMKYGIRMVTGAGGFVAAFGIILCYFANSMAWINLFWGGVHGVGSGLSTVIHLVILDHYFEKHKALVIGLVYVGECIGTLVFAIRTDYLLDVYGLSDTFLILGGCLFNVIPMALLLRKPSWLQNKKESRIFSETQPAVSSSYIDFEAMRKSFNNNIQLSLQENTVKNTWKGRIMLDSQDISMKGDEKSLNPIRFSSSIEHSIPSKETNSSTFLKLFIQINTKPIYILICISEAVFSFCSLGLCTIIIDHATDQGVPQNQAKFLILGFSMSAIVGLLAFGKIIDLKIIKGKYFCGVTLLLMGIFVCVISLCTSFISLMIFMCLFGFVQAGSAIIFPILVDCYMDSEEEPVAFGCLNIYEGLLMLCFAPMIGHFRDNMGTYNSVFHIFGGMAALMAIAWQLEPLLLKIKYKEKKEADIVSNT